MPDAPVLVIQLAQDDPPGRLADWLTAAGAAFEVVALNSGDTLPGNLGDYGGIVVLGGGMGAQDDADVPYLAAVRARLRAAVREEVPTLAICLGAQLLAVAHGGRVQRNPEGPEIGAQLIAKRSAAGDDPLFGPMPITPDVLQWHFDAITALPRGAILLASSPVCENQAYRLGRLAWGIQFHIETTPELVADWAREDATTLADFDLDRIVSRAGPIHADIAEVWAPFVAAFVAIVRDPSAVAPPKGSPSSVAAPVTDAAAIRAALAAEAAAARAPMPIPMPTMRPPWDE